MKRPIVTTATTHKHEKRDQENPGSPSQRGRWDSPSVSPSGETLGIEEALKERRRVVELYITVEHLRLLTLLNQFRQAHINVSVEIDGQKALPDIHLLHLKLSLFKEELRARQHDVLDILLAVHVNVQW